MGNNIKIPVDKIWYWSVVNFVIARPVWSTHRPVNPSVLAHPSFLRSRFDPVTSLDTGQSSFR